jgi:cell fate regulator YaaT (PSP1 superfamily)
MYLKEKCAGCCKEFEYEDDETKKQNFLNEKKILCPECDTRKKMAQPEPRTPKINIEGLEQNYRWSANYPDKWY